MVDGRVYDLREIPRLNRYENHDIAIIVDRLVIREEDRARLSDSVETALAAAEGVVQILERRDGRDVSHLFSEHYACADCGASFPELEPRVFSFNSPHGACEDCGGLGTTREVEGALLVGGTSLSVLEGAILPWGEPGGHLRGSVIPGLAEAYEFDPREAWRDLPADARDALLHGSGTMKIRFPYNAGKMRGHYEDYWEGRGRQHRAPLPRDDLRARALPARPVHVEPHLRDLRGFAAGPLRAGRAHRRLRRSATWWTVPSARSRTSCVRCASPERNFPTECPPPPGIRFPARSPPRSCARCASGSVSCATWAWAT